MIVCRKIEEDDVKSILNLCEQHSLQFPDFIIQRYPERWSNYFNNQGEAEYWVATIDNKVIGHAGFLLNKELDIYEIVGVVVSNQHQRKGIGRVILNVVSERIKNRGENKVILYTLGHPENEGTRNFYLSIGYVEKNYETDYFRQGYSRITFLRELL